MAIDAGDWTVDRATGNVRYTGLTMTVQLLMQQ